MTPGVPRKEGAEEKRTSRDVQQLLKHLPDWEDKCQLTCVLQCNEVNDLHEHHLYTYAWTSALRLKAPIALVLPDVFILANKPQTFS